MDEEKMLLQLRRDELLVMMKTLDKSSVEYKVCMIAVEKLENCLAKEYEAWNEEMKIEVEKMKLEIEQMRVENEKAEIEASKERNKIEQRKAILEFAAKVAGVVAGAKVTKLCIEKMAYVEIDGSVTSKIPNLIPKFKFW